MKKHNDIKYLFQNLNECLSSAITHKYVRSTINQHPTIWRLTLLARAAIDYFPPIQGWSSVISLMRLGDQIAAAERVRDKKGLRLLYFTGVEDHYFIDGGGGGTDISNSVSRRGRARTAECREEGLDCRCTLRCVVSITRPRALSAPPLIAVFVAAPTISLPSSYTSPGTLRYLDTSLAPRRPMFMLAMFMLSVSAPHFSLRVLFITVTQSCQPFAGQRFFFRMIRSIKNKMTKSPNEYAEKL